MKPKAQQRIALERIRILFSQADEIFNKSPELANEYVKKARRLAMRYEVSIPRELKRKFCKHCYSFLKVGKTLRVRAHKGKMVYFCFSCKKFMRFPYIKEKKNKK
ncbi:ribonuclease P [Candidatus Woesearchaeota archaeon]|nr:ribonuclease P [Candidatus Woesearchaeota archaeon]MBW3017312.1 ribonuclease P [Candidatus Woesearchaeota archaeon]